MFGIFINFAATMKDSIFIDRFLAHPNIEQLIGFAGSDSLKTAKLEALHASAKALAVAAVYSKTQTIHIVIIPEKEDTAYFYNDLAALAGNDTVYFFPSTYKRSVQYEQTEPANIVLRTETLNFLASGKRKGIIVTCPESIMEKVISRKNLKKNTFSITEGDTLSLEFLEEVLHEYNFMRVDFVYEPGQYAIRGSIADVFSYSDDLPCRIDFFGNSVDSIRSFSTDDQLSVNRHKQISIIPNIQDISIEQVNDSFMDFLPPSAVIWIEDAEYIKGKINGIYNQIADRQESGVLTGKTGTIATGAGVIDNCRKFKIIELGKQSLFAPDITLQFRTEPQPAFQKNFELLAGQLERNSAGGYTTCIVSESETQIERLKEIFSEINPAVSFTPVLTNLHAGFIDHDLKLAVFTDHQIFDRYHKFRIKGFFTRKESISVKELTGLNPGDYVVHIDHGIGKFGGLEKIEVNGKVQEVLRLVYRDNDILYVGIHSLHRISKYKGKDSGEPKIYKLGSGAWQKLKQATKSRVKDIAKDLIQLYAKRMSSPGYPFSPDSYLQRELEASFIYEDTPDQLTASKAVKEDMEASHPMDRLVCGDVGFGKTEIAIRAAFKATSDSRQTAILVPTTILAFQHYKTFTSRLRGFPCNIEYISRHRKPVEQKRILRELAEGKIDIIIGTHKLAGSEIKFKDLGLLIIDEEQRFGVAVKDRLKKLRANVDTLTLTATPIPRTLQFSLMGSRDLSIINTQPPNRMPIVTELHGYNEDIIKEGIEYEISRNGQVFFIHNRVENILQIEAHIRRLCPNIKTAVVHGQMDGKQVENVMYNFIQGDYDVLVATTIIESGLDIPNANTVFINDAHHFGLSELHQLRGRVGRSNRKAFCYLLSPPLSTITHEARRRLKAIEEYAELGSGFNISMQDLDIRGSGNLLGGEQSGFIADIGFETYQRILNEAMAELREQEPSVAVNSPRHEESSPTINSMADFQIDTDLEIMFPDEYISNIPERIRLYRELNSIETQSSLDEFRLRLIDRFGPMPPTAEALLDIVKIKWTAAGLGIEKILLKNSLMIAYFISDPDAPFYRSHRFASIMTCISRRHNRITMKQKDSKLSLTAPNTPSVEAAIRILAEISDSLPVSRANA
ncbi:MAG: transcription-repair coupling factor [Bacteroidales bacterium]|jgi:transcription-repair coupling factor (superfamily II helicase)|nr:transcription-repair coupling factor [Bacteroidales bacterium]